MRKPVVGWEGFYEVSTDGEVFSIDRKVVRSDNSIQTWRGRKLKLIKNSKGYHLVRLSSPSKRKMARVHRLVADAFIENKENRPEVNHKDGNRENNVLENLEWVTSYENSIHATRILRTVMPPIKRTASYELAKVIRSEYRRNTFGYKRLSKKYKISIDSVKMIIRGESYRKDFYENNYKLSLLTRRQDNG